MQALLENAAMAWKPIGQARRRLREGTLTVGAVLVPFIGIVIACNVAAGGAQTFFSEALLYRMGAEMPDHPLLTNDFSQRLLSAIGVLAPVGAVALLPHAVFRPAGRSATIAAMLVVAAAWAFYGAAFGIPVYLIAGALATVDAELGLTSFGLLAIPMTIGIVGLVGWFWFRILLSELNLGGGGVTVVTLVSIVALAVVAWFFAYVAVAST